MTPSDIQSAVAPAPTHPDDAPVRDLIVRSVGHATPAMAAAVSKGLGVPVEAVVRAVYLAPAVLMRQVAAPLAERLCDVLNATGLDVAAVAPGFEPGEVALVDVAAHVEDPLRLPEAAQALARFTGMDAAAALVLLTTPPGVVLGSVSEASVAALQAALPEGVLSLTAVQPESTGYALHLLPCADQVARGVLDDVRKLGLEPLARDGLVAVDLDHATALALWQRHSRTGALRLLHTAFLRYALSLHPGEEADENFTPAQVACLHQQAGVPLDMMDSLAAALPLVLVDDVPHDRLAATLATYAEVGLRVQADLSSFKRYRVALAQVPQATGLAGLTAQLVRQGLWPTGQPLPNLPCTLPEVMTRARARHVQAVLAAAGADVDLLEVNHG